MIEKILVIISSQFSKISRQISVTENELLVSLLWNFQPVWNISSQPWLWVRSWYSITFGPDGCPMIILMHVDTLRFACTCRFLSGRKLWYEYRESRTQHLCHNMRHRNHTPARRFAGDEHGNRTEPLRTSHGWSIYTMAVRAQISDNYYIKLIINRSGPNIWPRSILNN